MNKDAVFCLKLLLYHNLFSYGSKAIFIYLKFSKSYFLLAGMLQNLKSWKNLDFENFS